MKILVCGPNDETAHDLRLLFEGEGYSVQVCDSNCSAYEALSSLPAGEAILLQRECSQTMEVLDLARRHYLVILLLQQPWEAAEAMRFFGAGVAGLRLFPPCPDQTDKAKLLSTVYSVLDGHQAFEKLQVS
jgi:CheY-like chemotaxis protein